MLEEVEVKYTLNYVDILSGALKLTLLDLAMDFFEQDYSGLKYYRPGQIEALQALVTKESPETFWQDSSWNISDPSFRQIALIYYQQQEQHSSPEHKESLKLDDKTMIVRGDLSINKNLVISDSGSLVVLGNLVVDGNIFVAADYPSLYVAGEMRAENLYASQAEIITLESISIQNIFALKYNHTVLIAPKTRTKFYVTEDAFPDTEVESETSFAQLGADFFKATIDPSFEDTHKSENEYYEMIEEIDEQIVHFFCSEK